MYTPIEDSIATKIVISIEFWMGGSVVWVRESQMKHYYWYGAVVVVVETGCPGTSMKMGVGYDWLVAVRNLETIPIEGHKDPKEGLKWGEGAGWFENMDDVLPREPPICECECGCIEEAETQEEGVSLCEECASNYAYDEEGFLGCGNSGLGVVCPKCGETIEWGGIETGPCGSPNHRVGSCGCGDCWLEEDKGGWGHYSYRVDDPDDSDPDFIDD